MGNQRKQNKFFNMKASADGKSGDIFIYGEITKWAWEEYGEVSSLTFKNELEELGDVETINLYINSPGGSVHETLAIIALLERHPADVISHIDGIAASAASALPMISKKIIMYEHSMFMIHHAWTYARGNATQLRKAADDLELNSKALCQYYLKRAGDKLDEEKLNEMLDEEKWLTAEESFEIGFCDEIQESTTQAVAYAFDEKFVKQYKNVPQQLLQPQQATQMSADEKALREKILADSKANLAYLETII